MRFSVHCSCHPVAKTAVSWGARLRMCKIHVGYVSRRISVRANSDRMQGIEFVRRRTSLMGFGCLWGSFYCASMERDGSCYRRNVQSDVA
jgi:hypothetical protein